MRCFSKYFLVVASLVVFFSACQQNTAPSQKATNIYNITDFGALPDGKTMNTKAIQKAIDKATEAGGGHVIVPPGVFLSGTLFLKNNVKFEITEGATLKGSTSHADYQKIWRPLYRFKRKTYKDSMEHLIVIKNAKNVTLCGRGTIDGSGQAFWKPHDALPTWIEALPDRVSNMIELHFSKDVTIEDLNLTMPPEWTLHAYKCENLKITRLNIDNDVYGPNNDGIDITSCRDVIISDCRIITCDDAICFKSAMDGGPCERSSVTNCLIKTNCVALKLGSNETFQRIADINFSNCTIYESSRGIGLYSTQGGVFENINCSNITCETNAPLVLNRPIHLSCWNKGRDFGWMPPQNSVLRNITISNFTATTNGRILMTAQPGLTIDNVTLRDIKLIYPFIEDPKPIAPEATSHQSSPKNPEARAARAAIVAENMTNLVIDGVQVIWPTDTVPITWKLPKRIENGSERVWNFDYNKPRQCELSLFWGRNIQGGYIKAPLAKASSNTVPDFNIENSSFNVIK